VDEGVPVARAGFQQQYADVGILALTGGERSPAELAALSFFALWGVLLTLIDARVHRLPNRLVLTSYPVALALLAVAAATTPVGLG
jgi:leader peptidase (prepilin peptidase) / N-methyltransferase